MGLSKSSFANRDVFINYDFEDVMFRFDYRTQRFFRKSGRAVERLKLTAPAFSGGAAV